MNKIFNIFLFLCIAFSVQSQNFSSRKLAETGDLFPKNCLPKKDSIFNCTQILQGKSFVVNYNAKNEVSHLGVSLFSPETKQIINPPVCNFIERLLLELILLKSQKEIINTLKFNKIDIRKNGIEFGKGTFISISNELNKLQNPVNFRLQKDNIYTAVWEFGNNLSFTITFPVSRELIFGTDKKEEDQNIGDLFENSDDCIFSVKKESVSAEELTRLEGTDLYVKKGNIFLKNTINSDVYYKRSENKYQLFFDADFPEFALSNIFITRQFDKNLTLKITHRKYGGFTPEFSISLNKFFCIFDKGFDTYCIVQFPQQGNNIQISVVLHNRDFDYIHLLRIKTSTEQIFSENGILKADLYTNIPKDNLTNLFSNQ